MKVEYNREMKYKQTSKQEGDHTPPGIDREAFRKPQDGAYGLLDGCLPLSMKATVSVSILPQPSIRGALTS